MRSPALSPGRPRPEPSDVARVGAVSSIAVCQYRRGARSPGLLGEHRIGGVSARSLLEAIQAAPVGGGPDVPANCGEGDFGDRVLVLHLEEDPGAPTTQVYVGYASCRGNGFDDGVAVRELTREACLPLFEEPVVLTGGSLEVFQRCHQDMPAG